MNFYEQFRRMRPSASVLAWVAMLVLSVGCASVSGGVKTPENLPSGPSALEGGKSVGSVQVLLDQEQLPSEVVELAEQYDTARILSTRIGQQLDSRGARSGNDLELKVNIIGMRLRSNGTAIWWGIFAGSDWVTVDVEVLEGGRPVKTFQTGTSTSFGGFTGGALSIRVGRMMKGLAARVVEGI